GRGGGFEDHGRTRREGGEDPAGGDRGGKVPRRDDGGERTRGELGAVDRGHLGSEGGIVVGEVDRFADLGIALVEGLAALRAHDLEQVSAPVFEHLPGAVDDSGPFGNGPFLPGGRGAAPAVEYL